MTLYVTQTRFSYSGKHSARRARVPAGLSSRLHLPTGHYQSYVFLRYLVPVRHDPQSEATIPTPYPLSSFNARSKDSLDGTIQ